MRTASTSTDHARRDLELDNETVAVLCGAIDNGDLKLPTVRHNLETDLHRESEISGHGKYESELRDLRYRIRVRRRVLAEFEGENQ